MTFPYVMSYKVLQNQTQVKLYNTSLIISVGSVSTGTSDVRCVYAFVQFLVPVVLYDLGGRSVMKREH